MTTTSSSHSEMLFAVCLSSSGKVVRQTCHLPVISNVMPRYASVATLVYISAVKAIMRLVMFKADLTSSNASWHFVSINFVKWVFDGSMYPGLRMPIIFLNPSSSTIDIGRMSVTNILRMASVIVADVVECMGGFFFE